MQSVFFLHPAFMKRILFTALFFYTALFIQAQPAKDTLYGFQQRVIPGAKAAGVIDENGKFIKKQTPDLLHQDLYLVTASKTKVYPVQLWINGAAFSVEIKQIQKTPILLYNENLSNSKSNVLVPKTTGYVFKLTPVPLVADKNGGPGKALMQSNVVVLYYKKNGRLQYAVLKKFTNLSSVSLQ